MFKRFFYTLIYSGKYCEGITIVNLSFLFHILTSKYEHTLQYNSFFIERSEEVIKYLKETVEARQIYVRTIVPDIKLGRKVDV